MRTLFLLALLLNYSILTAQWHWMKSVSTSGFQTNKSVIASDDHIFILNANKVYHLDTSGTVVGSYSFTSAFYITDLKINSEDNLIITGSLKQNLTWGNFSLQTKGDEDIFIGAMNRTFSPLWAKIYGGKKADRSTSVVVNSKDENLMVGYYSDTTVFPTKQLISRGYNRMFLASVDKQGNFLKVMSDSMGIDSAYVPGLSAAASKIAINKNDEILLSGYVGKMNYYSIAGQTVSVSSPSCMCTGVAYYIYRLNSNFQSLWDTTMPYSKWPSYFDGLSSKYVFQLYDVLNYNNGLSHMVLLDQNGKQVQAYFPFNIPSGAVIDESDLFFAGAIGDEGYAIAHLNYEDSQGKHTDNQISRIHSTGFEKIAMYEGYIGPSTLLKGKNGTAYVIGWAPGLVKAGSHQSSNSAHLYIGKLAANLDGVGIGKNYISKSNFRTYPVPAKNKIFVELNENVVANEIKLYDQVGKQLLSKKILPGNQREEISLVDLEPGVYYLSVQSEGTTSTQKIIRE